MIGDAILFGIFIIRGMMLKTPPTNAPQFGPPTAQYPYQTGKQLQQVAIHMMGMSPHITYVDEPLPTFGPPDPKHPFAPGNKSTFV